MVLNAKERDYYPYWGETDWIDIAVLTTDTSMCDYYINNSRCNQEKYDCVGASLYSPDEETCNLNGGLWVTYPKFENCRYDLQSLLRVQLTSVLVKIVQNILNTFGNYQMKI